MRLFLLSILFASTAFSQTFEIKHPSSGKCIDVQGNGNKDETKIQLYTCNGTPAQQFTLVPVKAPEPVPDPKPSSDKEIAVYFQSWSAPWASTGSQHQLANLPSYVNTVLLAFSRPESAYKAGDSLWTAGLDFSSDAAVIKDAIAIAKSQGKTILLSVGGATYVNWGSYNVQGTVALATYLGVDGIDLDYEDMNQVCSWGTGGNACPKDAEFIDIIKRTRAAWPRPKLLTTAAWSTGAYGEGDHAASKMDSRQIGSNFGLYVNPLKQVGALFDRVYVMAYDAGNKSTTGYDWREAVKAYRKYFKGRLVVGIESAPEAWGGNVSDAKDAAERAKETNGIMVWSWQKAGGKELAEAAANAIK